MNKNVRIAKELLRIAKSLMADDEQQQVEQVMQCIENGSEMPSFVTNDPTVQKALQEVQQSSKRIMRTASSRRSFQANVLKTIMDKARKLIPAVGLALAIGFAGTAAAADGVPQRQVARACQEMVESESDLGPGHKTQLQEVLKDRIIDSVKKDLSFKAKDAKPVNGKITKSFEGTAVVKDDLMTYGTIKVRVDLEKQMQGTQINGFVSSEFTTKDGKTIEFDNGFIRVDSIRDSAITEQEQKEALEQAESYVIDRAGQTAQQYYK